MNTIIAKTKVIILINIKKNVIRKININDDESANPTSIKIPKIIAKIIKTNINTKTKV
jgi:hypothetical protein